MTLTISTIVTRGELSLADLQLESAANGYSIVSQGPGSMSWIRETVKSSYVHGSTLVQATKDLMTAPLTVRVKASSASTLDSRLATLLAAFSQFEYHLDEIVDGVEKKWSCQPADWSIGESGEFDKYHLMAKMYEVAFSIPRQPIPIVGSM